jgi:hypothetical protein
MRNYLSLFVFALVMLLSACQDKSKTLFRLLTSDQSGIDFNNEIPETDTFNILTYEYIYNGGGVGVADFNNDGLKDLFFAANLKSNELYLNEGDLHFRNVTTTAGVNIPGKWNSGVTVVDINSDGWMDVYVTATMHDDAGVRANMLFVNKGLNTDGVPTFEDQAVSYGIADTGYSVMAAFFDYDLDNDLDLYILTNQRMNHVPTNYRPKIADGSALNNDKLYRNNNDGTFTNVTLEAGIKIEGFGLGLAISDLNMDGWPDIYVSNDYLSNDLLYINNQDGTFTNRIGEFIGHQSQFSMGNDVADINNDAMPDIITTDMLPETNGRKKTTIGNKSYQNYINNEQFGYEYQYVRNMLHVNRGAGFSEIGQLAGVHQTEWSWSPLFADFNNDGFKDLFITNGFPKDITDKDFSNYRADIGNIATPGMLADSIPVVKIPNYAFRNTGNLVFEDVTQSWGLGAESFSNGAAFADLDNDGDIDYVTNNINDPAFVFENTLYTTTEQKRNVVAVELEGPKGNTQGLGAKVHVHTGNTRQFSEASVYRGFLSSVDNRLYFGLPDSTAIDSIVVLWPDKTRNVVTKPGGVFVKISYSKESDVRQTNSTGEAAFIQADPAAIEFKHEETDFIDFNVQRTIPRKFSQSGPGLAVGDVNNDNLEDLVIGASIGYRHSVFLQQPNGKFSSSAVQTADEVKYMEDAGLLLFDADNDNDLDLYIAGGGFEHMDSTYYVHRLMINDGKGNFTERKEALPKMFVSGSCVRAADFDTDGDLDLFVGGRVKPGAYPLPVNSYLLINNSGTFSDGGPLCPALTSLGMVTDAVWSDFNSDGRVDLVVVGEFMPVTFFSNDGKQLVRITDSGVEDIKGWWNSITAADFDRDGDIDYVAGNLGWNNNFQVTKALPIKIYAKDIDGNGSIDPILACYMRESMDSPGRKLYPVHFWDELNQQSPKFRKKYARYKEFAGATMETLLTPEELQNALVLEANEMGTSFLENENGKFRIAVLPVEAQTAPVNGIIIDDVNADGNKDILMVGNDFGNEVFTGRLDAFKGLVLLGDGENNFTSTSLSESGFLVSGDAKALVRLSGDNVDRYFASTNKGPVKSFKIEKAGRLFKPLQLDAWGELTWKDGTKERVEFLHGSGYWSQSSRSFHVPADVVEFVVYDSKGDRRAIDPDSYRDGEAFSSSK